MIPRTHRVSYRGRKHQRRSRSSALPAPNIEFAMLAIESSIPPPAVRLAASSSRSTSPSGGSSPSSPRCSSCSEPSMLRLAVAESSRPTSRGIDWSRFRLDLRGLSCSTCSCSSAASSRSSLSSSYSTSTLCQHPAVHTGVFDSRTSFPALRDRPHGRCDDLHILIEAYTAAGLYWWRVGAVQGRCFDIVVVVVVIFCAEQHVSVRCFMEVLLRPAQQRLACGALCVVFASASASSEHSRESVTGIERVVSCARPT